MRVRDYQAANQELRIFVGYSKNIRVGRILKKALPLMAQIIYIKVVARIAEKKAGLLSGVKLPSGGFTAD